MRMTGYAHVRPGYVVDHVKPLKRGGSDSPSNMQWQTKASGEGKRQMGVNRAEERFTHTVIVGRFRAILFQALCLALNFVCLVGALCQTNPIMFTLPRAARRWFLCGFAVFWLGVSMSVSARNLFPADVYGPELVLSLTETQQLHEKAWTLYYEGRYANAWEALDQALKITESLLGADHKDMAILQTTAAEGHAAIGDPNRVEELLSRSLLIAEKSAGKDSPIVARILKDFTNAKLAKGQIKEGEEMLARYEAIVKQRYPQIPSKSDAVRT